MYVCVQGGVHQIDRENTQPSKDMLKVLKTQDIKYVQAKAATDKKVRPCGFCREKNMSSTAVCV